MSYNEVESGGVWKPEVGGEKLEGILKSRRKASGRNGEDYTIFTIEEEGTGEERRVSGAVLESKLGGLEDGVKVMLTYKGKPKGTYKDYSVGVWDDSPTI
jgi:hypothetical protein